MNRRRSSTRKSRGFTIIEVLTSMGVMVIGVMAIVGLQQQTVIANSEARQMMIANQIAQTWIERLKQDAATWNVAPDATTQLPPPQAVVANTRWLWAVSAAPFQWQAIPNPIFTASNSFDFRGIEMQPALGVGGGAPPFFCVDFRPQWVYPGYALRVDVRVWWARARRGAVLADCNELGNALLAGPQVAQFHTMYLSTVLRNTPL